MCFTFLLISVEKKNLKLPVHSPVPLPLRPIPRYSEEHNFTVPSQTEDKKRPLITIPILGRTPVTVGDLKIYSVFSYHLPDHVIIEPFACDFRLKAAGHVQAHLDLRRNNWNYWKPPSSGSRWMSNVKDVRPELSLFSKSFQSARVNHSNRIFAFDLYCKEVIRAILLGKYEALSVQHKISTKWWKMKQENFPVVDLLWPPCWHGNWSHGRQIGANQAHRAKA